MRQLVLWKKFLCGTKVQMDLPIAQFALSDPRIEPRTSLMPQQVFVLQHLRVWPHRKSPRQEYHRALEIGDRHT